MVNLQITPSKLTEEQRAILEELTEYFFLQEVTLHDSPNMGVYIKATSTNYTYLHPVQLQQQDFVFLSKRPIVRWMTLEENLLFIGI